jgi:hypothetical protein
MSDNFLEPATDATVEIDQPDEKYARFGQATFVLSLKDG